MAKTKSIGIAASSLWVIAFALLLFFKHQTINNLTLNEWGDLFSGFAAPLALIWLIIGYIQQGEELRLNTRALEAQQEEFRLNTEALMAQQEELKNQVAATLMLAENTARQAQSTEKLLELEKMRMVGSLAGGLLGSGSR